MRERNKGGRVTREKRGNGGDRLETGTVAC